MLLKELVNKIQGASLHLTFDYEVDKKRNFYAIFTEVEPDIDTMRMLLDNLMEVHVRLFASQERGRYKMYEINHKRISDFEFE